jgi:hypothetical protein
MRRVKAGAVQLVTVATISCAKAEKPAAAAAAATPTPGANATSSAQATSSPDAPAARPPDSGGTVSASREAEEACVDKWLAARGLDPYGSPSGTMYAGGTPLFNERTGERVDRLAYVYKSHPLAREACRPTAIH